MPTVSVLNSSASLDKNQVLTTVDAAVITGLKTFNTGAAPFVVPVGSANVANLDANFLQGQTAAQLSASIPAAPTGTVLFFGGASAPSGWVLCNGQAISRAGNAALFALVGTTYGVGDGSTTFNVPDCRQRFPLGVASAGTGSVLAQTGGAIDHTHSYTQVLNHTHAVNVTDPGHDHTTHKTYAHDINAGLGGGGSNFCEEPRTSPGVATTGISMSTANPGGGVSSGATASSNPPYLAVNFILKT